MAKNGSISDCGVNACITAIVYVNLFVMWILLFSVKDIWQGCERDSRG